MMRVAVLLVLLLLVLLPSVAAAKDYTLHYEAPETTNIYVFTSTGTAGGTTVAPPTITLFFRSDIELGSEARWPGSSTSVEETRATVTPLFRPEGGVLDVSVESNVVAYIHDGWSWRGPRREFHASFTITIYLRVPENFTVPDPANPPVYGPGDLFPWGRMEFDYQAYYRYNGGQEKTFRGKVVLDVSNLRVSVVAVRLDELTLQPVELAYKGSLQSGDLIFSTRYNIEARICMTGGDPRSVELLTLTGRHVNSIDSSEPVKKTFTVRGGVECETYRFERVMVPPGRDEVRVNLWGAVGAASLGANVSREGVMVAVGKPYGRLSGGNGTYTVTLYQSIYAVSTLPGGSTLDITITGDIAGLSQSNTLTCQMTLDIPPGDAILEVIDCTVPVSGAPTGDPVSLTGNASVTLTTPTGQTTYNGALEASILYTGANDLGSIAANLANLMALIGVFMVAVGGILAYANPLSARGYEYLKDVGWMIARIGALMLGGYAVVGLSWMILGMSADWLGLRRVSGLLAGAGSPFDYVALGFYAMDDVQQRMLADYTVYIKAGLLGSFTRMAAGLAALIVAFMVLAVLGIVKTLALGGSISGLGMAIVSLIGLMFAVGLLVVAVQTAASILVAAIYTIRFIYILLVVASYTLLALGVAAVLIPGRSMVNMGVQMIAASIIMLIVAPLVGFASWWLYDEVMTGALMISSGLVSAPPGVGLVLPIGEMVQAGVYVGSAWLVVALQAGGLLGIIQSVQFFGGMIGDAVRRVLS